MSAGPIYRPVFHRFRDNHHHWVTGCVLCLNILGTAESTEELRKLEVSHECSAKRRLRVRSLLKASRAS
jgi:hypothetical protein